MFFVLPIKVDRALKRLPMVTIVLIAVNVAVCLCTVWDIRMFADVLGFKMNVNGVWTWFTSMFLHGDPIGHLGGNMYFLWLFGFFLYGQGIRRMGDLGAAVGWPLFMMVMVLSANLWSLATGEWRDAGPRALRYLGAGMAVLLVALAVIAAGTQA